MDRNFTPIGDTVSLACDTTTDVVALPASPVNGKDVVCYNAGSVAAFIKFGDSTVTTAATTGFPLVPGQQIRVRAQTGATHVAGITGSSTATVYFTSGIGS
jgi:hypothetical protein